MIEEFVNKKYLAKFAELKKVFSAGKPFPHLVLKNFFSSKKIEKVLQSLLEQEFDEKNTDLFQFKQSKDFMGIQKGLLKEFRDFFSSEEFLEFISKITSTNLKKIDMSAFIYSDKDYLLPHDDQLEGRKIAYVINLSKNFSKKNGGALELFNSKNSRPLKIVKSYLPEFNSLVLFKVSKNSWHRVSEVIEKDRISLTGWFHG
ncbi:MAG: 2OG-Fe(II) oxygenase family protein [Candidatus Diapherotrites archaeon]|nr:2OG-Fe(II) oxygenase family protein [Candidatus Diapherotrites archaeon]